MTRNRLRQAGGILRQCLAMGATILLISQPVAWPASPAPIGQITANGTAAINGASAVTGASVFSGDRIEVSHRSTAALALSRGSRVVFIGPSSAQVKSGNGQLTAVLNQGKVAFRSTPDAPLVVEASGTRTVPKSQGGVFTVALDGKTLEVTALKGSAEVIAANRSAEVPEGKTLRATLRPEPSPDAPIEGAHNNLDDVAIYGALGMSGTALGIAAYELTQGCQTVSPASVGCHK